MALGKLSLFRLAQAVAATASTLVMRGTDATIKAANHASLGAAGSAGTAIIADVDGKVPAVAIPSSVEPAGPFALAANRMMFFLCAGYSETIGSTTTDGCVIPSLAPETGWLDSNPYPANSPWQGSITGASEALCFTKLASLPVCTAFNFNKMSCRLVLSVTAGTTNQPGSKITRIKFEVVKISSAGTITVLGTHDRTGLTYQTFGSLSINTFLDVSLSTTAIAANERLAVRLSVYGYGGGTGTVKAGIDNSLFNDNSTNFLLTLV